MINEALESLIAAVEGGRSDVIQDIVETIRKCEENDEGIGLTLSNLFRSECSDEGTILHVAVAKKDRDSTRTLLSLGAFPSCKNEEELTAYDMCKDEKMKAVFHERLLHNIAQGNLARVQEFLDSGVSVECVDGPQTLNRPLHYAAAYGTLDIVQYLIENEGADVNSQNAEGLTPLHDAVQRNDPFIVQLLIQSNADPNIEAHSGKLAGKSSLDIVKEECRECLTPRPEDDLVLPTPIPESNSNSQGTQSEPHRMAVPHRVANGGISSEDSSSQSSQSALKNVARVNGSLSGTDSVDRHVYETVDEANAPSDAVKDKLKLLWPQPRRLRTTDGGYFRASDRLVIAAVSGPDSSLVHDVLDCWRAKRQSFLDLHIEFVMETIAYQTTPAVIAFELPSIVCHVDAALFRQTQSYKLTVLTNQVRITASDLAGLHYAVSTLIQLLEIFDQEEKIPCLQINDWPMMLYRAVMLDCSKGRILHESNLWELIDRLSILKLNEVHLYSRFSPVNLQANGDTGADKNADIWQFAYSRSMLLELDRFCRQRFVTLVPCLDVTPNVSPENLPSLFPLFSDFLSCFTYSRKINVGPRLSLMLLDMNEAGVPTAVNFHPLSDKHMLLLCSEALKQVDIRQSIMWLPANMTLMTYGYNAEHDFSHHIDLFSQYGCSFYVCPGSSSWNSMACTVQAAVRNVYSAIIQGLEHRTLGIVCCDWSGKGYVTDTVFSLAPLAAAAGLSWNCSPKVEQTVSLMPHLLDVHMLADQKKATGQILMNLGELEIDLIRAAQKQSADDWTGLMPDGGSVLYKLLVSPDQVDLTFLTSYHFQRGMKIIRSCLTSLNSAELQCYCGGEIVKSLRLTLELTLTACKLGQCLISAGKNPKQPDGGCVNVGISNIPLTSKTDIANRLLALREAYKSCWVSRHLNVGLKDSQSFLFSIIPALLPNSPDGSILVP